MRSTEQQQDKEEYGVYGRMFSTAFGSENLTPSESYIWENTLCYAVFHPCRRSIYF